MKHGLQLLPLLGAHQHGCPPAHLLTPQCAVLNKPLVQKEKVVLPAITKTRQGPARTTASSCSYFECGRTG